MAAKKLELNSVMIAKQYEDGLSSERIAELNFVSKRTVYRVLSERGVLSKPRVTKEDLVKCYCNKKMTITGIAKKYKTSKYSIRKALKKYDLKKNNKNEENHERTKK